MANKEHDNKYRLTVQTIAGNLSFYVWAQGTKSAVDKWHASHAGLSRKAVAEIRGVGGPSYRVHSRHGWVVFDRDHDGYLGRVY